MAILTFDHLPHKRDPAPAPTQRRIDPRDVLAELDAREERRQQERLARLEREAADAEQATERKRQLDARRARERQLDEREARAAIEAKERRRAQWQAGIATRRGAPQVQDHPRRSLRYPFQW